MHRVRPMSQFLEKYAKYLLLLLAVALMAYGIGRGEADVVWRKAVNVCLECIGIG